MFRSTLRKCPNRKARINFCGPWHGLLQNLSYGQRPTRIFDELQDIKTEIFDITEDEADDSNNDDDDEDNAKTNIAVAEEGGKAKKNRQGKTQKLHHLPTTKVKKVQSKKRRRRKVEKMTMQQKIKRRMVPVTMLPYRWTSIVQDLLTNFIMICKNKKKERKKKNGLKMTSSMTVMTQLRRSSLFTGKIINILFWPRSYAPTFLSIILE